MTIDSETTVGLSPSRLHPASPFIGLVFQARQLILPLGATFLLQRDSGFPFLIYLAVPLVIALIQFLSWRRFKYSVADDSLVVDKGLIQRHHREIPLDRIHHVEEEAKLQHRLFGVVNLKVDSGGGESGAEIQLDALSKSAAARLRAYLDGRPQSPGPIVKAGRAGAPPLVRIGVGRLIVGGVTNVPFATAVALVGSVIQLADEIGDNFIVAVVERVPLTATGIASSLASIALLYMVFAGGAGVVAGYGFLLERDGQELRTQKGLLDRRRAVVDLRRLTVIRVEETLIRRALRLCALRLQTVSGGRSGVGQLTVPIIDEADVEGLVSELMPIASPLPTLLRHPPAARRRLLVRKLALSLLLAAPLAWFWRPAGAVVGVLLLALAILRAEVSYRALGHATRDEVLVSREGGLRRETSMTTWPRAESTRLRSSPMQRWAGLATLYVDVPQGRSVAVADGGLAELTQLRELALTGPAMP